MTKITACLLSLFLLVNPLTAAFGQSLPLWRADEPRQLNPQLILNSFYDDKAKVAMQNVATYRARYNAIAFYSYPRTFWEDIIPGLPPYDKKGVLFTQSLQDTYETLKAQTAPDIKGLAARTVAEIALNPRRVNVAKDILLPKPGDVWHNAFYMVSFYTQIGDYAEKIRQEKLVYKDYVKYVEANNQFMLRGYENYDFTIAKYNPSVFYKRMSEIEAFIKAYSAESNSLIRKVFAPLQTDKIAGADVRKYVSGRIDSAELPAGVDKERMINTIVEHIPGPEYFYQRAGEINVSFYEQIKSVGKIMTFGYMANWGDITNALSMFEYISPGTLVERLETYGKIPSREQVLEELASSFAAEALNKSIAQISNDLFEFEKPFYYSEVSLNGAENDIVKNWHNIAVNSFYSDKMVAQIAADNILNSGRRAYQDNALANTMKARRIKENSAFYKDAIPIAIDFAGGDLVFMLVTPIVKSGRFVAVSRQKSIVNSLKGLEFDKNAYKTVVGAANNVKKAQKLDVASLRHVKSPEGFERAVWEIRNSGGEVTSYFKYGSKSELARTKQIDKIIKDKNLLKKYDLLEIEYPQIISEGLDDIPNSLKPQLQREFDKVYVYVRDQKTRATTPFIMDKVDVSGISINGLERTRGAKALEKLNNKPITTAEWQQVVDFYADLNRNDFYHTDIWHNLHLRRTPEGKLKITLIDFEHMDMPDMYDLEQFDDILKALHLKEGEGSIFYYPEFDEAASRANFLKKLAD